MNKNRKILLYSGLISLITSAIVFFIVDSNLKHYVSILFFILWLGSYINTVKR